MSHSFDDSSAFMVISHFPPAEPKIEAIMEISDVVADEAYADMPMDSEESVEVGVEEEFMEEVYSDDEGNDVLNGPLWCICQNIEYGRMVKLKFNLYAREPKIKLFALDRLWQ